MSTNIEEIDENNQKCLRQEESKESEKFSLDELKSKTNNNFTSRTYRNKINIEKKDYKHSIFEEIGLNSLYHSEIILKDKQLLYIDRSQGIEIITLDKKLFAELKNIEFERFSTLTYKIISNCGEESLGKTSFLNDLIKCPSSKTIKDINHTQIVNNIETKNNCFTIPDSPIDPNDDLKEQFYYRSWKKIFNLEGIRISIVTIAKGATENLIIFLDYEGFRKDHQTPFYSQLLNTFANLISTHLFYHVNGSGRNINYNELVNFKLQHLENKYKETDCQLFWILRNSNVQYNHLNNICSTEKYFKNSIEEVKYSTDHNLEFSNSAKWLDSTYKSNTSFNIPYPYYKIENKAKKYLHEYNKTLEDILNIIINDHTVNELHCFSPISFLENITRIINDINQTEIKKTNNISDISVNYDYKIHVKNFTNNLECLLGYYKYPPLNNKMCKNQIDESSILIKKDYILNEFIKLLNEAEVKLSNLFNNKTYLDNLNKDLYDTMRKYSEHVETCFTSILKKRIKEKANVISDKENIEKNLQNYVTEDIRLNLDANILSLISNEIKERTLNSFSSSLQKKNSNNIMSGNKDLKYSEQSTLFSNCRPPTRKQKNITNLN